MGDTLGLAVNIIMMCWTAFEVIILSFVGLILVSHPCAIEIDELTRMNDMTATQQPTIHPINVQNFNYSWVITVGIMLLSFIWYAVSAHKRYSQSPFLESF